MEKAHQRLQNGGSRGKNMPFKCLGSQFLNTDGLEKETGTTHIFHLRLKNSAISYFGGIRDLVHIFFEHIYITVRYFFLLQAFF